MKNIKKIGPGKYQYRMFTIEKKRDGWHYNLIDIKCGFIKNVAVDTKKEAETAIDNIYKNLRIGRY